MTLAQLEAASVAATAAYTEARDRLAAAQQAAQAAIMDHATVQGRFIGGAGTQDDVDAAAAERDDALAALALVVAELQP